MRYFTIVLLLFLFSCGSNEKDVQIEAQRAIESYIDSLKVVAIEEAKLEKDSIERAEKAAFLADSIRKAFVDDSLKKVKWYKIKAWRLKQKQKALKDSLATANE